MSRILAVRGTEGDKEVDYSSLSIKEIQKRIKVYEKNMAALLSISKAMIVSLARLR